MLFEMKVDLHSRTVSFIYLQRILQADRVTNNGTLKVPRRDKC